LCQDAIDMQQMLDYRGPSNFKVRVCQIEHRLILTLVIDRCLDFAFPKAATLNLHSLSPSGIDCEQHDHSGHRTCKGLFV
jgi:hypothetical protein